MEDVIIDYFDNSETYQLWNITLDRKHDCGKFESLNSAENYCHDNNLKFKYGVSCDG